MNLSVPLQFAKKHNRRPGSGAYLTYLESPINGKQSRFRGRVELRPDIDLAQFSRRAVIDFIVLRLATDRNSQFQHIKDLTESVLGRPSFVEAQFAGPGGTASVFDVKIHDPTMQELVAVSQVVDARYGLSMPPIIATLEISIDFTPISPGDVARARLLKTLINSFMPTRDVFADGAGRPRFTFGKAKDETKFPIFWKPDLTYKEARDIEMSVDEDISPAVDATFYAGEKHADSAWRIMDKILDRQNHGAGTRIELTEKERRVRIEVTLQRTELERVGLKYLSDLTTFSFTSFQRRYFRFWLPTFYGQSTILSEIRCAWPDGMRRDKFGKTGVIGLIRMDQAWEEYRQEQRRISAPKLRKNGLRLPKLRRAGSGHAGALVAFDEMNGAVSSALERLGLRVATDFRKALKKGGAVWFMRGR